MSDLSKFCRTKMWVHSTKAAAAPDEAQTILSPVSDLVFHLNNQSLHGTPRRRLSLDTASSSGTPLASTTTTKTSDLKKSFFRTPNADASFDEMQSCSMELDRSFEDIKGILTEVSPRRQRLTSLPLTKNESLIHDDGETLSPNSDEANKENRPSIGGVVVECRQQPPTCCVEYEEMTSPTLVSPAPSSVFLDEDSQDSGYSGSQGSRKASTSEETFLAPCAPAPHRSKDQKLGLPSTWIKHRVGVDDDDGFLEEFVEIEKENEGDDAENSLPCSELDSLLRGALLAPSTKQTQKSSSLKETPVKRKKQVESVLLVNFAGGVGVKRPSDSDEAEFLAPAPPELKRRKSVADRAFTSLKVPTSLMQRCRSESEVGFALQRCDENSSLIGDFSSNHALPLLVRPKVPDLNCIDGQTVSDLLDNRYGSLIEKITFIDCRYPYEYEAGHVRGAVNVFAQEDLHKVLQFNEEGGRSTDNNGGGVELSKRRRIVVFYCEYSKERGPKMSRFLRTQDRKRNEYRYPMLNYPEIYLLEGGYKKFYEEFREYCEPREYKPMNHRDHVDDLRKFRIKSKSWSSFGVESQNVPSSMPTRRPGLNRGLFT